MKHIKRRHIYIIAIAMLIFFSSWGYLVHRTVSQLAVYQLPKKLETFFYHHLDTIVQNSIRPDQRRNSDPTEAPKHFIDLEMYGDSAAWKMPHNWNDAVNLFSKDTLFKYGYVPYWVIAMKGKLTEAFRARNTDSILFYASDIAHYISDAHVPLHTSVYYDGQNLNLRGLHGLWESTIPELAIGSYLLTSAHKAKYLHHPEETIWESVQHAHSLLKEMWQQEQETSKDFPDSSKFRLQKLYGREVKGYTTAFARAYNLKLGNTINAQLIRSAEVIADFWYTAWVDAGRPDLNDAVSKSELKAMRKENKYYKHNELLKRNRLISRKVKVADPSVTQ